MQTEIVSNRGTKLGIAHELKQYLLMAYPMPRKINQLGQGTSAVEMLYAPPIELAAFEAKESMENTILRWMHRIISNQQQFLVQLQQTIEPQTRKQQLQINDKTIFQQMAKQLKVVSQYICSYDCPEMQFTIRTHQFISERIADPKYHLSMALQQDLSFSASFEVKEWVLLRKGYEFDSYRQVSVFALRP
jgi:hypothetical protein